MTVAEKIEMLKSIFRQISNHDVLSWKPAPDGYQWTCSTHAAAVSFTEEVLWNINLLGPDRLTFPHRFEPDGGPTVVFMPIADDSPEQ